MKLIFFFLAYTIALYSSEISLYEILEKIKYEHPMAKSIQAYKNSYSAQNRVKSSRKAMQILVEGANAKPNMNDYKYEYSVGFKQTFMNPIVKNSVLKSAIYQSDANILKLKYDFLLLENDVRLLYHLNCLDKKSIKQYKSSYISFKNLYNKKEKAYMYGEISKKDLLQLKIELDRLKNEFNHYKNEEKISRDNLQAKILLPIFEGEELFCKDVYSVTDKVTLTNSDETLNEKIIDKKIKSVESDFNRYNILFDTFSASISYQNEIDTDRFIIGLSVPLNFTSSFNEEKRAESLHKRSAYLYEKEALKLKKASQIELLQKSLAQNFQDIELLTSMLNRYENELMPLIERGYRLGEDSSIEYLLSQRDVWMFKKDLIEHYKNYYKVLFKLYSILEIKERL